MAHITRGFTDRQLRGVKKVSSENELAASCTANFNGFSECYAGLSFESFPSSSTDIKPINYTIHADGGMFYINVVKHTSDYEKRLLPLQWAVDSVRRNYSPQRRPSKASATGHHRSDQWS